LYEEASITSQDELVQRIWQGLDLILMNSIYPFAENNNLWEFTMKFLSRLHTPPKAEVVLLVCEEVAMLLQGHLDGEPISQSGDLSQCLRAYLQNLWHHSME
jgi:hypothetical protein